MRHELTLDAFVQRLKAKKLTDKRTGQNVQYEVNDAAQAAFAIFFLQSASFLAGRRLLLFLPEHLLFKMPPAGA